MGSSYHQLYYHFIWGTYKRYQLISRNIEKDLSKLIKVKIIEKKSELICFGCTEDHVHLLLRLHPSVSVSEMIGEIKGYSSFILNNKLYPEDGFRWQGGFGALTVSKGEFSRLIPYIRNQKDHHQHNDLYSTWELENP
jgi:REP element-mobilizing transposase RayT